MKTPSKILKNVSLSLPAPVWCWCCVFWTRNKVQSKHTHWLSHLSIAVARCRLVVPLPAWEWFGPSWLTLGPSHLPLCISTPPRWASWEINMMMKKITHFTNIKQKVSFTSLLLPVSRINEADITHQDGSFSSNVGPAVIWSFPNIPVMLQRKQKSNPSGFWLDTDTRTTLVKKNTLAPSSGCKT